MKNYGESAQPLAERSCSPAPKGVLYVGMVAVLLHMDAYKLTKLTMSPVF